ncbi:MAG: hypothetical protein E7022_02505 [Desulfovibrio desulfuricans]|uniref:DVU0524 family FlgM-associated protein n=1 Tax=uncultured Desulfovibrio sp. TaxID=167968 RepID=UPI001B09568F|nr:DVU0524 family FlgM-associated protein [uncultured Desulfovibrio sp.]MBE6441190.1 hypothetical protein [Desulfovibrio desulfuricans]MBO5489962.1 hypothetical protein [Desulfovibrio sp.]
MADATMTRMRIMLQGYEQQLLAARRLARFRVRRRLAAGENPNDPDPSVNRREMVEKVARELYETLIYTGSDNPVVEDIRRELGREVGQEVQFTYPPGGRLRIVGQGPDGLEALPEDKLRASRNALWRITRQKISESMLDMPSD